MTGIELIAQERAEQLEKHGWTSEHDAKHDSGALAVVAATLAVMHTDSKVTDPEAKHGSDNNPWGLEAKLKTDAIHSLQIAGALIAAEIDRIQGSGS